MDNTNNTLIGIQEEFAAAVMAGRRRWAHSKSGGHASRVIRGARKAAERKLVRLGMSGAQVAAAIKDAKDMAELELACE